MNKDLITKKDIKAIISKLDKTGKLTPDEASILQTGNWSEFQIQSTCYNLTREFGGSVVFLQIDNGGSAIEGIRKKKAATGTQAAWPDVEIKMWKRFATKVARHGMATEWFEARKSIYIEFKKVGNKPTEKQKDCHTFLKHKGESVHYCNNLVYYERVIINEIREFLK